MDVKEIKVGQVVNLHDDDAPCFRLVLEVTPETFWLGNVVGGRLHVVKEELAGAKLATEEQRLNYYNILKRNDVSYVDANGGKHPQVVLLFNCGDIIHKKGDKSKSYHKISCIQMKDGIYRFENGYELPFDQQERYERFGSMFLDQESKPENAIILNGVRYDLVTPQIESCGNCDLDSFCDRFKNALCDIFAGHDGSHVFKKVEL